MCLLLFSYVREEFLHVFRFMIERMNHMEYSNAHRLANDIRQSEEYQTYHGLKDEVMADETTAALIKEYKKLQEKIAAEEAVKAAEKKKPAKKTAKKAAAEE